MIVVCTHCGTEDEHYPGCIMDSLGFLARRPVDEYDFEDYGDVDEVDDARGVLGEPHVTIDDLRRA